MKDVKQVFNKLFLKDVSIEEYSDDAFIYRLFFEMYDTVPNVMYFFTGIDDEDDIDGEFDWKETGKKIEKLPEVVKYTWKGNDILLGEGWIVFKGTIFTIFDTIPDVLSECIVMKHTETNNLIFVSVNKNGNILKRLLPISDQEVDVKMNYNDDFPYERIEELISEDKSNLLLLYGSPGCGKSYAIRKLIKDNENLKFYWLDSSMFGMINSTEFMEFLLDCKGGVFVLEDCECIIKDRNTNYNNLITPILNISDGMLGDSLHLKFLCTFNTDLENIDSALLRKGRLGLKYEFKPLSVDKVQDLFDKFGIEETVTKEMPLCDVFNYAVDNGTKERKKIGF